MKGIIKIVYVFFAMLVLSITLSIITYTGSFKDQNGIVYLDVKPIYPFDIQKSISIEKPKPIVMPKHMFHKPIELHEIDSNVIIVHSKGTYTCSSELAAPFIILIDEGERVYFCMGYDSLLVSKLPKPEYIDEYTVEIFAPKSSFPIQPTNNIIEYSDFTIDEKYYNSGLKDAINLPKNNSEYKEAEKMFKKMLKFIEKKDMKAVKAMMTDMPGYEKYKMDEKAIKEFNSNTYLAFSEDIGVSTNTLKTADEVGMVYIWAHLIEDLSTKVGKCKILCIKKAKHKDVEHYIVIANFSDSEINGGKIRFWFRYDNGILMLDNFD